MPYACFICNRTFKAMYDLDQHERDAHDWNSRSDTLDKKFIERWMRCPYCREGFPVFNAFLYHVLCCCPTTKKMGLYRNRWDEVLSVFLEAVYECFPDRDWKIVSALDNLHYKLPLGIRNSGSRSPDVLVYSRKRKEAIIILMSITWETNMPFEGKKARQIMNSWYQQFTSRGFDCDCHTVEVGVRGLVSNSFFNCLRSLDLNETRIRGYSQFCSDAALTCSIDILEGHP